MKRLSALLSAVAMVGAATANAADLPAAGPAPSYTPVYRTHIYDWSGFYFGIHIGAGRQENSYTDTTTTVLEPAGNVSSHAQFGTIGGGQIGVNYQMTPVVVGLEGTWSATSLTGFGLTPSSFIPPGGVAGGVQVRDTTTTNWFATATARVGVASDALLLYVKGGGAWMRSGLTRDLLQNGANVATASLSDTRNGWTAGAGLEWGITENLSVKLEYDYLDFGTKTYTYTLANPINAVILPVTTPVSAQSQTHMITAGLNYRFTWGGGGSVSSQY
jgi:outer membrane immunogenic protein